MGSKLIKISGLEIEATYYAPPPPPPPTVPVITVPRNYIPRRTQSSYQQWLMNLDGSRSVSRSQAGSSGATLLGTMSGRPMNNDEMSLYFNQSITNFVSQVYSGSNEIDIVVGGGYGNSWANRISSSPISGSTDEVPSSSSGEGGSTAASIQSSTTTAASAITNSLQTEYEQVDTSVEFIKKVGNTYYFKAARTKDNTHPIILDELLDEGFVIDQRNGAVIFPTRPLEGVLYSKIISSVTSIINSYVSPNFADLVSSYAHALCTGLAILAGCTFPSEPIVIVEYLNDQGSRADDCPLINITRSDGSIDQGRARGYVYGKLDTASNSVRDYIVDEIFPLVCLTVSTQEELNDIAAMIKAQYDMINSEFTTWFNQNWELYKNHNKEIESLYDPERTRVKMLSPIMYNTATPYLLENTREGLQYQGITGCAQQDMDESERMWGGRWFGLPTYSNVKDFDLSQLPVLVGQLSHYSVPELIGYYS